MRLDFKINSTQWGRWQMIIFWVALTAAAGSIVLAFIPKHIAEPFDAKCPIKVGQALVLSMWVLGPPLWFWFEYFFLYRKMADNEIRKMKFDEYKHGVDVASKLWLALVTVLLGLYFGKDFSRTPSPSSSGTPQSSVTQKIQSDRTGTFRKASTAKSS